MASAVNPIFVLPFRVSDAGTVTASSESGENVVTNIQDQRPSRVWKTSGDISASDPWIVWDFGAAKSVNALCIGPHNIGATIQYKVQAHTSNSWGSPAYDSGWIDAREPEFAYGTGIYGENYYGGYIDTGQLRSYKPILYTAVNAGASYRYYRVLFHDPLGDWDANSYIEIGRAALDRGIDVNNPYFWGYTDQIIDPSPIGETAGGFRFSSGRPKRRAWRDLQFVCTMVQWKTYYLPLIEQLGMTKFFYALLDESSDAPSTAKMDRAYARLVAASEPKWASNRMGRFSISIEQAL